MSYTFKAFVMVALMVLCFTAVTASERQPLFQSSHYSAGASTLPQRFQEMIQRRHLTTTGSYGYGTPGTYGVYGR